MYGLVIFSLCLSTVYGQYPRACTTREALDARTCCPAWKDGSACGSASGRGQCRDWVVFTPLSAARTPQPYDDRLNWPRNYYDKTCECFGNYSGYNCGDCKYGYFGDTCNRTKMVTRKEIRELSLVERQKFFSYLALAKTTKSKDFVVLTTGNRHYRDTYRFVDATIYDVFSWIHYYAMKPIMVNSSFIDPNKNYAHQGPAFPGWHRLGLLFIEKQIQLLTGDEYFAIPYYDWRGEKNCSICTDEFVGGNDVQGNLSPYSYFADWKSFCSGFYYVDAYCPAAGSEFQMERVHRNPGGNPLLNRMPSFQDVEDALKWRDYDRYPHDRTATRSFRNVLEGFIKPSDGVTLERNLHNLVHLFLGGTMAQIPISSNDPIFLMHHSYIDKLFDAWITKYNGNPRIYPDNDEPGQGPNECSTPYFPCYLNKDLLQESTKFGYNFSEFQGM